MEFHLTACQVRWIQLMTQPGHVFLFISSCYHIHPEDREPKDPDEILEEYRNEIYNHWDPSTRQLIYDLPTFPYEDEAGVPIKIYDRDGQIILRHNIYYDEEETPTCGILLNLQDIDSLFTPTLNTISDTADSDSDSAPIQGSSPPPHRSDPTHSPIQYYVYPQAFLKYHGHIQAKQTISSFNPSIVSINHRIQNSNNQIEEDDVMYHYNPPIALVAFQAYNQAMHRIRSNQSEHDVQLGLLTVNFCGTYSSSDSGKATARRLHNKVSRLLPHQRFAQKIDSEGLKCALRLENVFKLDLFALQPRYRRGRYVLVHRESH